MRPVWLCENSAILWSQTSFCEARIYSLRRGLIIDGKRSCANFFSFSFSHIKQICLPYCVQFLAFFFIFARFRAFFAHILCADFFGSKSRHCKFFFFISWPHYVSSTSICEAGFIPIPLRPASLFQPNIANFPNFGLANQPLPLKAVS